MTVSQRHGDLIAALRQPGYLAALDLAAWDGLLPLARAAGVLGRLATSLVRADQLDALPPPVRWHLTAAANAAAANRQGVAWELCCLARAFEAADYPLLLLKGAAYVAADLPPAVGRTAADVDLLVPRDRLAAVESRLLGSGWLPAELDPRDAAYFRRWMHEIPPLRHPYRNTELDVHHNVLPRTDRLQVDPQPLLDASQPIAGTPFRTLAPADMVLHAAAHLARNGNFARGLSDLVDIDLLIRHFHAGAGFWPALLDRAARLRLGRPLWLVLRYAERYLHTPVPAAHRTALDRLRPARPIIRFFDRFAPAALLPSCLDGDDAPRHRATWLLAHYPVPRLRAMLTPLFWLKRVPVAGKT